MDISGHSAALQVAQIDRWRKKRDPRAAPFWPPEDRHLATALRLREESKGRPFVAKRQDVARSELDDTFDALAVEVGAIE